jgi:hypothetical protein
MSHKRILFVLLIAALALPVLGISPSASAQEGPKPEAVGLRPDAPSYAVNGPYWVGIQDFPITFEYQDGTTRESRVTIWYPALNPDGKLEPFSYPAEKAHYRLRGPPVFSAHGPRATQCCARS